MCSVIFVSKPPDNTVTPYLLQYFYASAISHGYLTQPYFKRNLGVSLCPSPSSFHTPLGITGCWSERLRETPSSLEILRFIPWTEQHQDVANAANASILWRLSDDCANTSVIENKKNLPQSGYDRQNVSRKKGNKKQL